MCGRQCLMGGVNSTPHNRDLFQSHQESFGLTEVPILPGGKLHMSKYKMFVWFAVISLILGALPLSAVARPQVTSSVVNHTPDPTSVTVAGSLQSELGCTGDWQSDCATTHLAYDVSDDVWQGTWTVPAGSYEYKAALNDSWDENYGVHATPGGANIHSRLARIHLSSSTTTTRATGSRTTRLQ